AAPDRWRRWTWPAPPAPPSRPCARSARAGRRWPTGAPGTPPSSARAARRPAAPFGIPLSADDARPGGARATRGHNRDRVRAIAINAGTCTPLFLSPPATAAVPGRDKKRDDQRGVNGRRREPLLRGVPPPAG